MYYIKIIRSSSAATSGSGRQNYQSLGGREKLLPSSAQVVICGGGVVGSSVAYHLPKYGFSDVILLEQGRYVFHQYLYRIAENFRGRKLSRISGF